MRPINANDLTRQIDEFMDSALDGGATPEYCQFLRMLMQNFVDRTPTITITADTSCQGCLYRSIGRYQKCSTCRRNQNLKDNYRPE